MGRKWSSITLFRNDFSFCTCQDRDTLIEQSCKLQQNSQLHFTLFTFQPAGSLLEGKQSGKHMINLVWPNCSLTRHINDLTNLSNNIDIFKYHV